ncbi:MAG: ABC transporter ATP-binding protein [Pseudomonadota bacterium]
MSLSVTGLTFAYGRKPVLHDVEISDLAAGQVTALIGPNAAGKSTLFRCIAGLLKARVGTVTLDGKDLGKLRHAERVRRICYMPQLFSANAALSVFDVVLLARKSLHGWRVEQADIDSVSSVLKELRLGHMAKAHVGELSGGQQQMVSIAQAFVREPKVFLFDEPTSALDLRRQLEVMTIIRETAVAKQAVVVVALHDLNLAARFADNLLLMREGCIMRHGPPAQVLADDAVSQTYGVSLDLVTSPEGNIHVSANL